jgi:glycosyltransferase involved in cell wall biosynthesis
MKVQEKIMEKISVLLATYNPNERYLIDLMNSLNSQDYGNFDVLIRDDYSDVNHRHILEKTALKHLTNVSYEITYNQMNMGSNKTFEKLTKQADGGLIAFCDQDDIWESEKLSTLAERIKKDTSIVAYSDMKVIDRSGALIDDSYRNFIKGLIHPSGTDLYSFFLRKNSITGCSMIIRSDIAKYALPFPDSTVYVHDHWLLLVASCFGEISYIERPLIRYRIHANNQIGAKNLEKIDDKNKYIHSKIAKEQQRINYVLERHIYKNNENVESYMRCFEVNLAIRNRYLEKPLSTNFFKMIALIKQRPSLIIFELILGLLPSNISRYFFKMTRNL